MREIRDGEFSSTYKFRGRHRITVVSMKLFLRASFSRISNSKAFILSSLEKEVFSNTKFEEANLI